MTIPVLVRSFDESALSKKQAFWIALINSIVVGLFWAVMTINAGEQWNVTTCVLYFIVNRFILIYEKRVEK